MLQSALHTYNMKWKTHRSGCAGAQHGLYSVSSIPFQILKCVSLYGVICITYCFCNFEINPGYDNNENSHQRMVVALLGCLRQQLPSTDRCSLGQFVGSFEQNCLMLLLGLYPQFKVEGAWMRKEGAKCCAFLGISIQSNPGLGPCLPALVRSFPRFFLGLFLLLSSPI